MIRTAALFLTALLFLCTAFARGEEQPAIIPRLLGLEDGETSETLKRRFLEGQNLQLMLVLPEANEAEGRLLDPRSVSVYWGRTRLPHFVYYRTPAMGLIFALLEPDAVSREKDSGLVVFAGLTPAQPGERPFRLALPLSFEAEETDALARAHARRQGRPVSVRGPDGTPLHGAYVFGQRRGDMLARANSNGTVWLDRPARGTASPHHAWASGYWTLPFDPVSSQTLTLTPRGANPATKQLETTIRLDGHDTLPPIVLIAANYTDYYISEYGEPVMISVPEHWEDIPLILFAPGSAPLSISLKDALNAAEIVLPVRADGIGQ